MAAFAWSDNQIVSECLYRYRDPLPLGRNPVDNYRPGETDEARAGAPVLATAQA
jgi:hypothetical protein